MLGHRMVRTLMRLAKMDKPTIHFAIPGSIQRRTGGYNYDRHVISGLRERGRIVRLYELDDPFSVAAMDLSSIAQRRKAERTAGKMISSLPEGAVLIIDGLALPAFESRLRHGAARLCVVALIHHLLADESGLEAAEKHALQEVELRNLGVMRHVVVTSRTTAATVQRLGVSRTKISVVEPGTNQPEDLLGTRQGTKAAKHERGANGTIELISVGALIPRKGHLTLLQALAAHRSMAWRLTCFGSLDADRQEVAKIRALIEHEDLTDRVNLAGEVDDKDLYIAYRDADIFVLASKLEGYGMAFAEALAYGLPVVGSGAGAVATTVPTDAGLLVAPGDPVALAAALERVMTDASFRGTLAAGAAKAGRQLPSWRHTATQFDATINSVSRASSIV